MLHHFSDLPFLAIVAATVGGALVGALWYSNAGFLSAWTKANGAAPVTDGISYGLMTLAGLLGAAAVAVASGEMPSVATGLHVGLLCGVAVAALSVTMNHAFRPGRMALSLVDGGFHVVRFVVYGVIIGWWPW